jgi:outer membrane protein OmpA-like peptidoglycan-associated protein
MKKIILSLIPIFFSVFLMAQVAEIPTDDKAMIINEATVNSANFEFSPAFYENGIVFISTDKTTKNKFTDKKQKNNKGVSIQIARRSPEGILMAPDIFSQKITSAYNDGPLCFDRENKTMFYSTNNVKNGKQIKSKNGRVCQRILMATSEKGEWSNGVDLPFNSDEFDNCHPSISIDGNILYFSSNREGGVGGMDIYMSKKEGDTWGNPVNLGPDINTEKNDVFPFIHANGTLFYASDGKNGLGGYDIFSTKPNEGSVFSKPENIGKPFNSEADDFGLILDSEGKNGYFSSNRAGGKGEDDIYSFRTENVVGKKKDKNTDCKITVYVVEKTDGKEIEAVNVKVMNITDYEIGEVVTDVNGSIIKLTSNDSTNILTSAGKSDVATYQSSNEGKAELKVKNGKYLVNISKNGYQNKQIIVNGCQDRDEILFLMEKVGENTIPLAGVLKGNRGNPIPNATVTLTDEATNETQVITTDNEGKYKYFVKPDANYKISVTKDNFLATSTKFSTKNMKKDAPEIPISLDLAELTSPLPEGKIFQLNNVYYNYNDASLRPDARLDLDPLVALLKAYPEVEIELSSHTDARGKSDYNQSLSQRRAESAVKYLTDRGIAAKRIKAVGYGETQPRNQCRDGVTCTEEQHKINRRTEVKVTKASDDLDISVIDKLYNGNNVANNNNTTVANSTSKEVAPTKTTSPTQNTTVNNTTVKNSNTTTSQSTTSVGNSSEWNPASGEFWVVAGSYQNAKNADDQAASLSKKGYLPVIIFASDINFYRVLVEKTSNLNDARKLLKTLKSHREPAFVLRN